MAPHKHLLLLCFFVAMFSACSTAHKNTVDIPENDPDQRLVDARVVHTDSGVLRMVTYGKEILCYDDEKRTQVFPKGVKASFFKTNGKKNMDVTADEATHYQNDKLMNLRKNVVIRDYRSGDVIYAEDFYWDQNKKITYSDKPVLQIMANGDRMRGQGFRADEGFNDFRLVKGRLDFQY